MTEAAQAVAAPKRDSMVRRWFANWRKKRAKRKKLTLGERLVAIFTGPRFIAFVLLAVLAVGRMTDVAAFDYFALQNFDAYQKLKPRTITPETATPPAPGVAIIDIDERSLAELGQWPWPRTLIAALVQNLTAYGAIVIGFDVFFTEPDRTSPALFAKMTEGLPPDVVEKLATMPSNEAVFADMLRKTRVVLGQSAYHGKPTAQLPTRTQYGHRMNREWKDFPIALCPPGYRTETGCDGIRFSNDLMPNYEAVAGNLPELDQAAPGHGMVTVDPERDGIVRRVPAVLRLQDTVYPSLAVDMLRVAFNRPQILIEYNPYGLEGVVITPQFRVNTDPKGRIYVNYRPYDPNLYISAYDVLTAQAPQEKIQGKLVLVGTSALGLQDIRATPLNNTLPGVEVHANILETIMTNSYLTRPLGAERLEVTAAIVAGLLMILFVPMIGAGLTLVLLVALVGGLIAYSWNQYSEHLTLIDVTYPILSTFALYLLLTVLGYIKTSSEKRQVRGAFAQYLSPALVEQLAADPDRLKLGGEMKDMTFLFCDVRGFTTISESFKSDPQGLTKLINRFLTPMTDIILARQGTIDKYMGDCIMAFWNAPLDDEHHAEHAADSALTMFAGISELNANLKKEAEAENRKFYPINIGIGLNSGEVVVGNMGSQQRFDYSVLGDAVNLASRLEGQSKAYHVGVVIGETTEKKSRGQYATLELDLIAVKGKAEAVRIFTLVGRKEKADSPAFQAHKAKHDEVLAAYRAQQWDKAEALLAEVRKMDDSDMGGFYDLIQERIDEFRKNPPGANWDGVFRATSK